MFGYCEPGDVYFDTSIDRDQIKNGWQRINMCYPDSAVRFIPVNRLMWPIFAERPWPHGHEVRQQLGVFVDFVQHTPRLFVFPVREETGDFPDIKDEVTRCFHQMVEKFRRDKTGFGQHLISAGAYSDLELGLCNKLIRRLGDVGWEGYLFVGHTYPLLHMSAYSGRP